MEVLARTGHELELEILRKTTTQQDYFQFLNTHHDRDWPLPYCLEHAKQSQEPNWNPLRPPTDIAFTLRFYVSRCLLHFTGGRAPVCLLGLYVTVGQAADFYHGIDFFLALDDNVATVDITMKPQKVLQGANFLLRRTDIETRSQIRTLAEKIARHLLDPKSARAKAVARR